MLDKEKLFSIRHVNGGTFAEFVQACKKHLSMTYEEAVEWLHHLKDEGLVIEHRALGIWTSRDDYKDAEIFFVYDDKTVNRFRQKRQNFKSNHLS